MEKNSWSEINVSPVSNRERIGPINRAPHWSPGMPD
jgi:hypothetical protein